MNLLGGKILNFLTEGNLTLVNTEVNGECLKAIVIGYAGSMPYLKPGGYVELLFNETEVSIAKTDCSQISLRNQLTCLVNRIDNGKIFSRIYLQFFDNELTSLITTQAASELNIKVGDKVIALIKTNEVFLKQPDE